MIPIIHQWTPVTHSTAACRASLCAHRGDKQRSTHLTMGPSCRMCSSRTSGLSLLRSRWMKVRVSCTSTDGTSVKRSVSPCQIWSPADRYVELRYSAAVVSAVNRDTDTKMELGSRILTYSAIWGMRRAASLWDATSITFPTERESQWKPPPESHCCCSRSSFALRQQEGGMFSQTGVVPGSDCRGRWWHRYGDAQQTNIITMTNNNYIFLYFT